MTDDKDTSKHDPITDGALNTKLTPQDIERSIVHITHDSAVSGDDVDWHTICSHPKEQRSDDILLEKIERIVELEQMVHSAEVRETCINLENDKFRHELLQMQTEINDLNEKLSIATEALKAIKKHQSLAMANYTLSTTYAIANEALERIEQTNMGEVK